MSNVAKPGTPATHTPPTDEIDELLNAELWLWAFDHATQTRAFEVERLTNVGRFRRVIERYTADPSATVEGLYAILTDRARRDAARIAALESEVSASKRARAERESLLRFEERAP